MKTLAFGALFVGLLTAACGGGKTSADAKIIVPGADAGPDGGTPAACNVTAQTGCATGQKCTWIRVAASTTQKLGQLGCVMDGTVALDGACTYGPSGTSTGFDNCQKGLICLASSAQDMAAGTCSTICDLAAVDGAGACPTNYGCGSYSSFFGNGNDPVVAGVCDPQCDILTQKRLTDNAAACGSPTPASPELGCYGGPSRTKKPTEFRCAGAGDPAQNPGPALVDADAFLNSCAPGYVPLFFASETDQTHVVCTAFCQPADTTTADPGNANGKPGSGFTCADFGMPANAECRYVWAYESSTAPTPIGKNSHLGVCFDYSKFLYDDDANSQTPDVADPSCASIAGDEALSWGCVDVTVRPAFKSKLPFRVKLTDEQIGALQINAH